MAGLRDCPDLGIQGTTGGEMNIAPKQPVAHTEHARQQDTRKPRAQLLRKHHQLIQSSSSHSGRGFTVIYCAH